MFISSEYGIYVVMIRYVIRVKCKARSY